MLTKKVDCKQSELHNAVLPLLRGRVFHVAEVAALDTFMRRGAVPAGFRGQLATSLCPAPTSYGAKRGYLCLFDFRGAAKSELEEAFVRHYFLKPFHYGSAYGYLFLAPSTWPKLIPWTRARGEVGTTELYIPFVEAWYPGDLPLDSVSDCLIVNVQSTAAALHEIISKGSQKATT